MWIQIWARLTRTAGVLAGAEEEVAGDGARGRRRPGRRRSPARLREEAGAGGVAGSGRPRRRGHRGGEDGRRAREASHGEVRGDGEARRRWGGGGAAG